MTLGGGQQPYSNSGNLAGEVSFRHPYGKKGNFLSFDAHVETLTAKNDVLSTRTVGMPQ